jgi:hypothetical protein
MAISTKKLRTAGLKSSDIALAGHLPTLKSPLQTAAGSRATRW